MPAVTFTLTDTPEGGVSVHTDFKPAIGAPCSAAQSAALEIISRTRRDWDMPSAGRKPNAVPSHNHLEESPETGRFPHDA